MTSAHIFFIPLVLLVGLVLGIALGRRSAFLQIEEERRREQKAAERKARADAGADVAGAAKPSKAEES
jgi:hypothetical protein